MKNRYRLIRRNHRGGKFYCVDTLTNKRESLKTADEQASQRIVNARNEADHVGALNLQIARAYLSTNQEMLNRTWKHVMDQITKVTTGATHERYVMAFQDGAFDVIRNKPLIETTAAQFLTVLETGTVSTNVFLRRLQNYAIGMAWLLAPVLPKKQWPAVKYKEKRAITSEEHQKIIARERNPEWKAFYELLWQLGGSQTDVATLHADDIDWTDHTIAFSRRKTTTPVLFHFGEMTALILRKLPSEGPLFPRLAIMHEKHRAKQFAKRLSTVGVSGISLHSYRYSVAERMKSAGYPERFAQQALGHASKAVARAYAKKAQTKLPSLEEFEKKIIPLAKAI